MDQYGRAKVGNFGLAKLLRRRDKKDQLWLAPECKDFKNSGEINKIEKMFKRRSLPMLV